jgi:hypothetical protein
LKRYSTRSAGIRRAARFVVNLDDRAIGLFPDVIIFKGAEQANMIYAAADK